NCFGAKLAGNLIDSLALRRRRHGGALGNLSLNFAFDLRLDRAMLTCPPRLFNCQFVVVHDLPHDHLSSSSFILPISSLQFMAERVGFEPTERFPVHSISSAANSTTLAPLRKQ